MAKDLEKNKPAATIESLKQQFKINQQRYELLKNLKPKTNGLYVVDGKEVSGAEYRKTRDAALKVAVSVQDAVSKQETIIAKELSDLNKAKSRIVELGKLNQRDAASNVTPGTRFAPTPERIAKTQCRN
jgi:hypothetical protein